MILKLFGTGSDWFSLSSRTNMLVVYRMSLELEEVFYKCDRGRF